MTMPEERTWALLWDGGFLIELARDEGLPIAVRSRAVAIARHFPTVQDVSNMAMLDSPSGSASGLRCRVKSRSGLRVAHWNLCDIPLDLSFQTRRRCGAAQSGARHSTAHSVHRKAEPSHVAGGIRS